ncbi:MAG: hypothetical protein KKD90_04430, partial [Candidatus Omnitrophica bacterium]|nr:hypothetical protein [Candidatus Omnitrophota bacterium]
PSTLHPPPSTLIVAGGIGVAPLVFLAEKLAEIRITVLLGAKTKKLILCEKEFKKLGAKVHITTDDGTRGCKGFVTDLFKKMLCAMPALSGVEGRYAPCAVYACGPRVMLECIADMCVKKDVECEVSLEEKMACGIGACLGCAVRVKGEGSRAEDSYRYKLACKDGPVFKANKIIGRQV